MRGFRVSALAVFIFALLASLSIHLPIYGALGALAKLLLHAPKKAAPPSEPVSFEIIEGDQAAQSPSPTLPLPRDEKPSREEEEKEAAQEKPAEAKTEEKKTLPIPTPKLAEAKPPPPPDATKQAIKQRSRDPQAEPPPDSKYIAKENQRVEEETVASLRNYQRDDPEPTPDTQKPSESKEEKTGNDEREEIADMRERKGPDRRDPVKEAAPAAPAAGGGSAAPSGGKPAAPSATAGQGGAPGAESEGVVVNDGMGSFVLPKRRGPVGAPLAKLGLKSPRTGLPSDTLRPDERPRGEGAGDRGGAGSSEGQGKSPNLKLSWSQFESMEGGDSLQKERETYQEERKSRVQGFGQRKNWKEFRAAIENFVPHVRPGNQTALNAAASPFADYLTEVHIRIHREFADRFLRGIPAIGSSPFSDFSLYTKLEIVLNADGSIHRVGIIKTSGFLLFDHGAFNSVMRGQPYPAPPAAIKSTDGRVYFHWGFYRNERQCGTFNAEPFILKNPPSSPPARDTSQPKQGALMPPPEPRLRPRLASSSAGGAP